jgi:spore coat protein SA
MTGAYIVWRLLNVEGMTQLKVLVIVPEQLPVPPVLGGSVESCTHNVFKRMAGADSITLICRSHRSLPRISRLAGGRYRIVRIPYAYRREAYLRAAITAAKSAANGSSYDIIQIENRPTFVPAVRKAFPHSAIVLSLHSLTFMSKLSRRRAYSILSKVDGVVTVVSFLAETMKKKYPKYAHKFRSAVLGVDTAKFRPRSGAYKHKLRRKWGVSGTFNVLFVGRIVPKKGLHTLVRAVHQVKKANPRTRLVAVGASWPGRHHQTAYMRRVRSLSRRLNVPIRFTGYIPPARVHKMYHLGDVFVCPTQFREGFATVNSEAMASGIPTIASNRGGIREVVRHGRSGLLVSDYKSPNAFASAIKRVMRSQSLSRSLSIRGRQAVKAKLSWSATVIRLRSYYRLWRHGRG